MRYILMLVLILQSLYGAEVAWNSSFEAAKAQAQKENKIIYVVITSETCRWCRKLESTTLKETVIINNLNQKYAPVALTRNKDKYPPCLKAPMVPMTYFLAPDGRVIYSVPGYWETEDYFSMMGDVERKYRKQKKAAMLAQTPTK